MRFRQRLLASGLFLALSGLAGSALAHDFAPPPWRLTNPTSTVQAWDFLTATNPTAPDGLPIPVVGTGGGAPTATMSNMHWDPGSPTDFPGVWVPNDPTGGFIELFIPNYVDFEPLKMIRVQITFVGGSPSSPPIVTYVDAVDNVVGATAGAPDPLSPPAPPIPLPPTSGIFGVYEDWIVQPNPDWETIGIFVPADTSIDQIVVDTISLPEPATLALLALGSVVVLKRRHS